MESFVHQTCYSVPFMSNQQFDHNQELKSTYKAKWSFSNKHWAFPQRRETFSCTLYQKLPLEHSQAYFKLSLFIMWFPETCVYELCLIANNVTKCCLLLRFTKA